MDTKEVEKEKLSYGKRSCSTPVFDSTGGISFPFSGVKHSRWCLTDILEEGVEVLKKYNFRRPLIGNHKLNVYLKTIRDICGIDKPIFSHVARLLGHKTTKLTTHYAKLLDKNIIKEVGSAFGKV